MRKLPAFFLLALLLCLLALSIPSRAMSAVKAADAPAERCNECVLGVQARYEQCLAIFEGDERSQRCQDQYNEGIVQCYRNFCEQ